MTQMFLSLYKPGYDFKIGTMSSDYNSVLPLLNFLNRMFNVQVTRLHPIETSPDNGKHIRTFCLFSCKFFVKEE